MRQRLDSPGSKKELARENMAWGSGAFMAVAVALVAVNAGPLMSQDMRVAMHSSRFGSADTISLNARVSALSLELRDLGRSSYQLEQRVSAANRQGGTTSQRITTLEASLPDFLEQLSNGQGIDQEFTTASTGKEAPSNVDQVRVRMVPMNPVTQLMPNASSSSVDEAPNLLAEEMKNIAAASDINDLIGVPPLSQSQFALDFGKISSLESGVALWDSLQSGAGTLLFGLEPLLRNDTDGQHLVVGPIADVGQVLEVCQAFSHEGFRCEPVAFEGDKLAQ